MSSNGGGNGNGGSGNGGGTGATVPNTWSVIAVVAIIVGLIVLVWLVLDKEQKGADQATVLGIVVPAFAAAVGAVFGVAVGYPAGSATGTAKGKKSGKKAAVAQIRADLTPAHETAKTVADTAHAGNQVDGATAATVLTHLSRLDGVLSGLEAD